MRIVVTDMRGESSRELEFHDSAVSIGSDSANLLQLPSVDVPPYLAMLMPLHDRDEETWTYLPVDPATHARMGDQPIAAQRELKSGDRISIDRFTLEVLIDAASELELPESTNLEALQRIKHYPLPPGSETQRPDDPIVLGDARLRKLTQFAVRLGRVGDFVHLLEESLKLLRETLEARKVWIGVRRQPQGRLEFVDGLTADGKHPGDPPMLETFVYRCLGRLQHIRIPRPTDRDYRSIAAIPIMGRNGAVGLMYADTGRGEHRLDADDMRFMYVLAQVIGVAVDAIAGNLVAQQGRLADGQTAFLREVQGRLDPTNVPVWSQLQVAVFAKPGVERAGDVYDITRIPNGLAAVMLGHVRAEPTRAAMVMTEVRSAFRIASLHADPPHIQLRALSWLLHDERHPCELDCLVVMINPKTGAFEYSVAGRCGALVVKRSGEAHRLKSEISPAVGAARNAEYPRLTDRFSSGESLVLFSAGCGAVRNAGGQTLGEGRFVETVCDGFGQSAAAALDGLLVDLGPFLKTGTPPDDITILYLHRIVTNP